MKLYAAYGSNLNLEQMRWRCPGAKRVGDGCLYGYRLVFRGSGSGAYLSIDKDPTGVVPVGIFSITKKDEANLDLYEGYPRFYDKFPVKVHDPDTDTWYNKVMIYALPETAPMGFPSASYVRTCVQGYKDFGFDKEFLEEALLSSVQW